MKKYFLVITILIIWFFNAIGQPFIDDINRFKELDRLKPPPRNAILFIGSSSFTMWQNVQESFPDFTIINRGFGGSTLEDLIRYVEDIVYPYNPKQIVVYCGENDFASSDTISVELITQRFVHLYNLIVEKYPEVKISYVSMKPSPSRWHLSGKFIAGNNGIQQFLDRKHNTSYIDVWSQMLNVSGIPDSSIFLDDMLHMNSEGYKIWQKTIQPHLVN
ncbi:MAG: GDSL-type esterase/lipase family protein [Tenuifilaceae bacterium]|jgi:lysophospholipase L1-like esterase|nr:GDSL-type esterase/lipase family protein [Tenuifilaceae bacterium]